MILVTAAARCQPGRREETLAALREATAPTRQEPGCLSYRYYCDIDDEHAFTSVEEWTDRDCLAGHFQTSHVGRLLERLGPLLVGEPEIRVHEVSGTTGPPG